MDPLTVALIFAAVGGIILTLAGAYAYSRQGTVKAALETITVLKAQVDVLTGRVASLSEDNERLTTTIQVLQGQVTQAAPVRELMEWAKDTEGARVLRQAEEHQENLAYLNRLEGGISRVETAVLRDVARATLSHNRTEE